MQDLSTCSSLGEQDCMGSKRTVLVVDDTEQVLNLVARILREAGLTVLTASNAVEAFVIIEQQPGPIHLLLSDIYMPGATGTEFAMQVRLKRPEMKIMLMSVLGDRPLAQEESWHFIAKPFGPAQLRDKVLSILNVAEQDDGAQAQGA